MDTRKLCTGQITLCEIELTEKDLYDSIKNMGNDGLAKEFCITFWDNIKATFFSSIRQAKEKKDLSISQRQAIIKLTEKRTEIRDIMKM